MKKKLPQDTLPRVEGWRNYPTWALVLWLENDQANAQDRDKMIRAAATESEDPQEALETALMEWVTEKIQYTRNLEGDLIQWASEHIYYSDIATHYLQDFDI